MRFGVLGFAHVHAPGYTACIASLPEAELVAIADSDLDRLSDACARFGVAGCSTTAELVARGDIDAVLVMAENTRHREMVEAAAAAGKHVLCEKPLAATRADGQAMIDACRRAGVKLGVVFPVRFSRAAHALRDLLDRGEIGRPLTVKATNPGRVPPGWFTDPTLAGGGAVMDHTVHLVDLLRWFFDTEIVQVYAEIDTLLHPGLPVDDVGLLMLTLANGITASLDASWSRPRHWPTWGGLTIEVVGERGVAAMDAFRGALTLIEDGGPSHELLAWDDGADVRLVRGFIEAVERGEDPPVSGEDGLRALEVALAAYRSAAARAPVACTV